MKDVVTTKIAAEPEGDWSRFDAMSEEERHRAALLDPDAQPLTDEELAQFFRPRAQAAFVEVALPVGCG